MARINLAELRKSREARLAKTRNDFDRQISFELLDTDKIAKGSRLWTPPADKPIEFQMRVLQFLVSNPRGAAPDSPGDFATYREYLTHYIASARRSFICPSTFGKQCPVCEFFYDLPKDARSSREYYGYRPKVQAIFNALMKSPGPDGKPSYRVVVFRHGSYASIGRIQNKLKNDIKFINERTGISDEEKQKLIDSTVAYADLELGYWFNIRNAKAAVAGGTGAAIEFSHFIEVTSHADQPREMISQDVADRITDLDLLIPDPPTVEEINAILGKPEVEDGAVEEVADDIPFDPVSLTLDSDDDPLPEPEEVAEEEEEETEEKVEEKPAPKPRAKKKAAKKKPEPEPEPEEEPEEVEDSFADFADVADFDD